VRHCVPGQYDAPLSTFVAGWISHRVGVDAASTSVGVVQPKPLTYDTLANNNHPLNANLPDITIFSKREGRLERYRWPTQRATSTKGV